MSSRSCTKCGLVKPLDAFYKSNGAFGKSAKCKLCENALAKEYRKRLRAENELHPPAVQEKICYSCKRLKTGDEFHVSKTRRDGLNSRCKTCTITSGKVNHAKDPSKKAASSRAWMRANPEKRAAIYARRKHLERTAPGGPYSPYREDYKPRVAAYAGLCAYCRKVPYATLEHAVPLTRGGTNFPDNIYPACRPCNGQKFTSILGVEWTPPCEQG